jgi:hypothetical protein
MGPKIGRNLNVARRRCILPGVSLIRRLDSWITWGVAGVAIGLGLGVNAASAWLVAAGLGFFIIYLEFHPETRAVKEATKLLGTVRIEKDEAIAGRQPEIAAKLKERESNLAEELVNLKQIWADAEGSLFAGAGVFIVGWMLGFIVRGLVF